ncbi:hypothetical protein BDV18DRAFT_130570 [Aspergillus unguis]
MYRPGSCLFCLLFFCLFMQVHDLSWIVLYLCHRGDILVDASIRNPESSGELGVRSTEYCCPGYGYYYYYYYHYYHYYSQDINIKSNSIVDILQV